MEGGNGVGGSVGMEVGEDDLTDEEVTISAKFKMKSVKSVTVRLRLRCCENLKALFRLFFI